MAISISEQGTATISPRCFKRAEKWRSRPGVTGALRGASEGISSQPLGRQKIGKERGDEEIHLNLRFTCMHLPWEIRKTGSSRDCLEKLPAVGPCPVSERPSRFLRGKLIFRPGKPLPQLFVPSPQPASTIRVRGFFDLLGGSWDRPGFSPFHPLRELTHHQEIAITPETF